MLRLLKYQFIIILSFSFQTYSQEISWISFEEATENQKINPKNIIIDIYTNWCGPCKLMEKNTFKTKF